MKATCLSSVRNFKTSKLCLLGIAAGLIAINLNLAWKAGHTNVLGTSVLGWGNVSYLLWKKRNILSLKSRAFSRFLGILLIILVLLKSITLSSYDPFIRISSFLSVLGLGLLASGIKGLKQYWQELIIFLVLAVPTELIFLPVNQVVGVSTLTAKFSTFVLWYLGFQVSRQEDTIFLPTVSVWVSAACAGMITMLWLLQLAVLLLVIFPTNLSQKILVPIVAVFIGFVVNGVRVAMLVVLAASNHGAFEYWHSDHSQIFSLISALTFCFFCLFLLRQNDRQNHDSIPPQPTEQRFRFHDETNR